MKAAVFRSGLITILIAACTALCLPPPSWAVTSDELVRLFRPFPRHFNAAVDNDISVTCAAADIFVSLLEIDANGAFQPYLASWWDVSEDEKTYTFQLLVDTLFHDGHRVTSEDVVFSYHTFREYHPLGERLLGRVTEVEAPDSATFIVHLSQPDPALLLGLSSPFMPILPKHVYDGVDILQNPANIQPVGSGPFQLTSFQPGERFVLERFGEFFMPGRPWLQRIIGISGENPWFAISAMKNGTAHLFTFARHPDIVGLLANDPSLRIQTTGYEQIGGLNYLEFNLRKAPLKKQRVRKAIAHAIDLEQISAVVYQDTAFPLSGPLPLKSRFHSENTIHYGPDLNAAEQLLDEAGLKRGPDGTRFETRLTWQPDNAGLRRQVAEIIRSRLDEIGIRVVLDPPRNRLDWHTQIARWRHHMNLAEVKVWGDPLISLHQLFSSRFLDHRLGANTSGFVNEQADVLLDAAGSESNGEIRSQLYGQFQVLISDELPLLFMHEAAYVTIMHRHLQGFPHGARGVIGPLDRVYWKKESPVASSSAANGSDHSHEE